MRADDLAKLDPSNRALQQQVWDLQDAQEAAKAAQTLADAWKSVGDTIMTEIKRIRGLNDTATGGGFAQLQGQFNAASNLARVGDQDAAKSLPGLSQALLTAAANAATSKQELDCIRAQTAASLEATYGAVMALTKSSAASSSQTSSVADAAAAQGANTSTAANDDTAQAISDLRSELASTRQDLTSALSQIAGNTGAIKNTLDNVTLENGGKGPRYHYDADAIAERLADASVARLAQNVDAQAGSDRVPGKTNGAMKAVGGRKHGLPPRHAQYAESSDQSGLDTVGRGGKRNKRSVWTVPTQPFSEAHFATFPPALIEPCILAGCPVGGTVLDPFGGAGTTGLVADRLQRNAILTELNPEYAALARRRIDSDRGGLLDHMEAAA